jgi:methylsterol monooxygenase
MYANPIEFALGNLAGVALGPVLTNCHPYTAYFWFAFSLITTGGSHSGYVVQYVPGTGF